MKNILIITKNSITLTNNQTQSLTQLIQNINPQISSTNIDFYFNTSLTTNQSKQITNILNNYKFIIFEINHYTKTITSPYTSSYPLSLNKIKTLIKKYPQLNNYTII